jgi:hypothetical protein
VRDRITKQNRGHGPLLQVYLLMQERIAGAKAVHTGASSSIGVHLVRDRIIKQNRGHGPLLQVYLLM